MVDIKKPNDIFVAVLNTPDANVFDLKKSNMTPENTSLYSKDTYKESDYIKKYFTGEDGKFDEKAFDNAYLRAYNLYAESSDDKFLAKALQWDANDLLRPIGSNVADNRPVISKDIYNPDQSLYGRTSLNSVDPGLLSMREIAQTQKVKDYKTGKDLDYTPNDLTWGRAYFNPTLVYATWDEDGVHKDEFSGREVKHKKGERKLNDKGTYYVEELGDREVYGKEVVNPTDLITVDGSAIGSVDFFDSDGRTKSTTGIIMKTAFEIAPFFIPYVGEIYAGFKASEAMAGVLPTLYKSLEGIILGDSTKGNETDLYKAATKAEGFMARFNATSFSEEGQSSMFSKEQLASMVGMIFGQLYEQRAVASLSKTFYKINNPKYVSKLWDDAIEEATTVSKTGLLTEKTAEKVGEAAKDKVYSMIAEKQSRLAKNLSTAYMAITSTSNMYEDAIAAGYDRRTAGLAAFAAMLGQYGIMHVEEGKMQTWFLDKGVGFDDVKSAQGKVIKPILDDIEKTIKATSGVPTEEAKKTIMSRFKDLKNFFTTSLTGNNTQSIYKNAMIEGVQEVVEQSVLDATKGTVDALSYLGFTEKQGSFDTWNQTFSEKGLETYLANLLGGIVGGSLFEVNRLKIEPMFKKGNPQTPEVKYELERRIANGEADALIKEATEMTGALGNQGLNPTTTEINGQKIHTADGDVSQADLVLAAFTQHVRNIQNIMQSEGLMNDNKSIIKKTILDEIKIADLERTGVHNFILSDVNELSSKIIDLKNELNNLDKDKDSTRISEVTKELGERKSEYNSILSGEKASYYTGLSIFAMNSALSSPFLSLNIKDYTKTKYNTDFDSLPETGGSLTKNQIQNEFNDIMSKPDNNKQKLKFMYSMYKTMLGKYSGLIGEYGEENHIKAREEAIKFLNDSKLINSNNIFKLAEAAKYFNITPNLDDKLNLPLGEVLNNNGLLDNSGVDEDTVKARVEALNRLGKQLPFRNITTRLLSTQISGDLQKSNINIDEEVSKVLEGINKEKEQLELDKNNISYSEYVSKSNDIKSKEEEVLNKAKELKLNIGKNAPKFRFESDDELPLELMYFIDQIGNQENISSHLKDLLERQRQDLFKPLKERIKPIESLYTNDIVDLFPEEEGYLVTPELLNSVKQTFKDFKLRYDSANSVEELNTLVKDITKYNENIDSVYKQFIPISLIENNQEAYDASLEFFKDTLKANTGNIQPITNSLVEKADILLTKPVIEDKFFNIIDQIHMDVFRNGARDKVKILQIIQDEINQFEKDSTAPQNYVRTQNVINDLEEIKNTLNLMKSLTAAMLDSSTEGYAPYGFNNIMQKVAKESGENPEDYKTINGQTYNLLNKELNNLTNKVEFLIDLAKTNSGTLWENEKEIKNSTIKLRQDVLTNKANSSSPLNITIKDKRLLTEDDIIEVKNLNLSPEEEFWKLEDIIYNNFNSIYKDFPNEALEQLHSYFNDPVFIKNLAEITDSGLYKNQGNLSNFDYFVYLHSILAVKNSDFYGIYKNILEKELTLQEKKVPFFSQENTIRIAYSYVKGNKIMNSIYDFMQKNINSNPNVYKSDRAIMNNLFFVIGSGGVGKTSVIANYLSRMLSDAEFDKFISATDAYVLDKSHKEASRNIITNNTVQENNKLQKVTESELLKLLLKDSNLFTEFIKAQDSMLSFINDNLDKISITSQNNDVIDNMSFPEFDTVIKIGGYTSDNIKISDEFKKKLENIKLSKKTIIFADEVSYFSPLALQIISKIASNPDSNLYFIGSGDNLQDSFTLSEDNPFSLDHFHYISAPRLKGVIRGQNIHKKDNNENLEILVKKLIDNEDVPDSIKVLTYYQTNNILNGDKFTDTLDQSDLESLDKSLETAVITEDGLLTSDIEDKFKKAGFDISKLKIRKRTDVKGEEFDQVVSLVDLPIQDNNVSKSVAARRFYTLLTRAKVASIIVGNKSVIDTLGIVNQSRKTTSPIIVNSSDVDKELDNRIKELENVSKEEITVKNVPEPTIPEEPTFDISDLNPTVISTPVFEPIDTKQDKNVTDGFMVYSFSNILHGNLQDNKLELKPLENNEIPSDLQILNLLGVREDKLSENGKLYVNNFIQMKNILLHRFVNGFKDSVAFKNNNIFSDLNNTLLSDGQLVLRKLKVDGQYIESFGKQAHKLDEEGNERKGVGEEYLYLSYKGKYKGKDFYITLASLPNPNSINSKFSDKKVLLEKFYKQIPINGDLPISGNILEVYSGISLVNEEGKIITKSSDSKIKIEANTFDEFIEKLQKSRGLMVQNTSEISVFSYDKDQVSKKFLETGYKKPKNVDASNFTGRPYLQVSYVDPNNPNVSKLIVLNPRSRSIEEAIREYSNLILDNKNDSELQMLISQYDGLKLLYDLPKSDQKIITNMISDKVSKDTIKTLENILSKKSFELVPSIKDKLLKNNIPNLGLIIFEAVSQDKLKLSDEILNTIGYYNQKYQFKKGETGEMILPNEFIKYFSFNYYLEPPRFYLYLGNIQLEQKPEQIIEQQIPIIKENQPKTDNVIVNDKTITSVNILGETIQVDTSNWSTTNDKPLSKMMALINLATKKAEDINTINLMGDRINDYKKILLDITQNILRDPSIININNLNVDISAIDNKVNDYFENNEIFSENSLGFTEEQLEFISSNFVYNSDIFNDILTNYNLNNNDNNPCN